LGSGSSSTPPKPNDAPARTGGRAAKTRSWGSLRLHPPPRAIIPKGQSRDPPAGDTGANNSGCEAEVNLKELSREDLEGMLATGEDILECYRVLRNTGDNVVGEVLRGEGTFYEWNHYPKGDIYDNETHSQHFYHAHPTQLRGGEHGHFHTFLRAKGMPAGMKAVAYDGDVEWPTGDDALSHLVAISMDRKGYPIVLFTTNRWVTGETWYAGEDVSAMVDLFVIDHARPSWPVNRWITAMVRLFRPQIRELLAGRDAAMANWRRKHPDRDVFEDRELEITTRQSISVEKQIAAVRAALD
jgi:hypothetical protein